MASDSDSVWTIADSVRLHWRHWDDEYVVFNDGSGDTHLLGFVGAAILKELEARPAQLGDLSRRLAQVLDVPTGSSLPVDLPEVLERFAAQGLVERRRVNP